MHDQDKEKLLAIIVIIVIILGALGYFLWNFVLNKGTIVFNGNPPYTITVNDKEYECVLDRCELIIAQGTHKYSLSKEGYNSLSGTITLDRGQEIVINAELTFIPILSQPLPYTMFSLPTGYSKFEDNLDAISLFKTYDKDYPLKRLPKTLENIVFSQSGERALVFEEDQVSTYQIADYSLNEISGLEGALDGAFSPDESFFYTIAYDEEAEKDALKRVPFSGETFENIVFFTRNIEEYELTVSFNHKYVALADKTGETETLYLIDLNAKSRTNVFEGSAINLGEFTYEDNYLVFEGRYPGQDLATMKYLDVASEEVYEQPFESDLKLFDFADGPLGYFVSDSDYKNRGVFVDFVEDKTETLTVADLFEDEIEGEKPLNLYKWDPVLNEYFMIANLQEFFEEGEPLRIEATENGNIVRLLVGEMVYDLMLGEA